MIYPPFIAQESATEESLPPSPTLEPSLTPVPTETPLPSETATELPSATPLPTETATETATASPTQAEITAEVTIPTASETATASATNTATATSSATMSATAVNVLPPYTVLLVEELHRPGHRFPLLSNGNEFIAEIPDFYLSNSAISLDFRLSSGSLWMSLRRNAPDEYRLVLSASGNLSLYDGAELLAMTSLLPLGTDFHNLHFRAYEDKLIVDVDGISRIVINHLRLAAGRLAFGSSLDAQLELGDLSISTAQSELDAILQSSSGETLAPVLLGSNQNVPLLSGLEEEADFSNTLLYSDLLHSSAFAIDMTDCNSACNSTELFQLSHQIMYPQFSPDGSHIAFIQKTPYTSNGFTNFIYGLYVLPSDGSETVPVKVIEPMAFTSFDWSVYGIAYTINPPYPEPEKKTAVLTCANINQPSEASCGRSVLQISGYLNGMVTSSAEQYPAWSPDGRLAVLQWTYCNCSDNAKPFLTILSLTGSNAVIEESLDGYANEPSWSPDGSRIAFASDEKIYLYTLPTGETEGDISQLAAGNETEWLDAPVWSPDGLYLAFWKYTFRDWPAEDSAAIHRLEVANPNNQQQISGAGVYLDEPSDWGHVWFCPIPETQAMRSDTFSSFGTGDDPICGGTPEPTEVAQAISLYVNCVLPEGVEFATGRRTPSISGEPVAYYWPGQRLGYYGQANGDGLVWYNVSPDVQNPIYVVWIDPSNNYILLNADTEPPTCPAPVPTSTPTASPTPTATLDVTATPTNTATPFVAPTLYPVPTDGGPRTDVPANLCSSEPIWLQNICRQGWGYLDNIEVDLFEGVYTTTAPLTFIELDTWFLQNLGRSVQDVPARVWAGDADLGNIELASTCAFTNLGYCRRIIQDVAFLFENMTRIGVDSGAVGDGLRPSSIPPLVTFVPTNPNDQNYRSSWFLPINDHSYTGGEIFGGIDPQFACGSISFQFPTHGYVGDGRADVCWVCQDLPSQLYSQLGFNLQNRMRFPSGNFNPSTISGGGAAQEVNYRNVGVVREYLRTGEGQGVLPQFGSQMPYKTGEMVLLLNPFSDSTSFYAPYHVGIVVRGSNATTFEQALDDVLIAQISYSSQGFYTSSQGASIFAPSGTVGKFEVITLRTYLIKAIRISYDPNNDNQLDEKSWLTQQLTGSNITWASYADTYLQHLAPQIP